MLGWFQALMPKEERFFDLFERHAQTLVDGAEALQSLLKGGDDVPACCARISRHEAEADAITRDVHLAVRRTFITPFDRGDIQSLSASLDDAIDQMQKTAKAITLFEVREFEEPMRDMGKLILRSAEVTNEAVPLLRSMGRNATKLNSLTEEITRLEDQADGTYDRGMKELFLGSRDAPMRFIVGAEVYDHLEKVMDRFEDVANRISSILVEHL
jgi:predicted phosphate transport protein (TIGR00153 family)